MRPLACLLVLAAACGSSHSTPDARRFPDAPIVPDAVMVDAAPPVSPLYASDGATQVSAWSFGDATVGARAGVTLFLGNGGATKTSKLALSITGTDAADVAIDTTHTTCAGMILPPGDQCRVALVFTPAAAGARDADLHVAGVPIPLDLPLHGDGVLPDALASDTATLDFGPVERGQQAQAPVLLTNDGTSAITLGARSATAGFAIVGDNCPAMLTAGGACTLQVRFSPTSAGVITGTLTAASSANTVSIALRGLGERRVSVMVAGSGAGTVTSTPGGIDCGTTCSGLFVGPVTLTATPAAGVHFAGWTASCGTATTCALDTGDNVSIGARFEAADAKQVAITFAGGATGQAIVYDAAAASTLVTCTASCTTYVAPAAQIVLYGFTPSTFAGWTGDCTSSTHDCNLGTVVNDRAATVTFTPDEREVATLTPPAPPLAIAYTPDGDLIVADASAVRKLTPAGQIVWTAAGVGGAVAVATDDAGHVFGLSGSDLFGLSAAGALSWKTAVPGPYALPQQAFGAALAASPDGTVIAVLQADGAFVVDGAGAKRFQATGVLHAHAVAVDASGIVAVANDNGTGDTSEAHRYDKTGAPLATLPATSEIGYYDIAIAYDTTGDLCAHSTGFSHAIVSRTDAAGAFAFLESESTSAAADLPTGLAVASTGDLIAARGTGDGSIAGLQLEQWSPTGTVLWSHVKTPTSYVAPLFDDGVNPTAIAADGAKHVAVAGTYGDTQPWIQIYALP